MTCGICGSDHDTDGHVEALNRYIDDPDYWSGPQHVEVTVRTLDGLLRRAGVRNP